MDTSLPLGELHFLILLDNRFFPSPPPRHILHTYLLIIAVLSTWKQIFPGFKKCLYIFMSLSTFCLLNSLGFLVISAREDSWKSFHTIQEFFYSLSHSAFPGVMAWKCFRSKSWNTIDLTFFVSNLPWIVFPLSDALIIKKFKNISWTLTHMHFFLKSKMYIMVYTVPVTPSKNKKFARAWRSREAE